MSGTKELEHFTDFNVTNNITIDPIEIHISGAVSYLFFIQTNDYQHISWGDGSADGFIDVEEGNAEKSHTFTGASTIKISHPSKLVQLDIDDGSSISDVVIPATAINMTRLYIWQGAFTSFTTHVEWTALQYLYASYTPLTSITIPVEWTSLTRLYLDNTSISSLTTHAEWTALTHISIEGAGISSLTTHAEWVNLQYFDISNTSISSITTHAEWTAMVTFDASETSISSITIPVEWVNLSILNLYSTSISALTTHSEWVNITAIRLYQTSISSITTYNTWTSLATFLIYDTSITTLTIHPEWVAMVNFDAKNNAITSATDINNILIALDTANQSSGYIYLNGGTNACPTGAGLTAKTNLEGRGVTVNVNTGCPTTTTSTTSTSSTTTYSTFEYSSMVKNLGAAEIYIELGASHPIDGTLNPSNETLNNYFTITVNGTPRTITGDNIPGSSVHEYQLAFDGAVLIGGDVVLVSYGWYGGIPLIVDDSGDYLAEFTDVNVPDPI